MTENPETTRTVTVEREQDYPPETVWRALTQPHLIAEWLMQNDFAAEQGHRFSLSADWGRVDCEVLTIQPYRALSYTWNTKDLSSTVYWTLTPTEAGGTMLQMEQTGFQPDQGAYFNGARAGWPRFVAQLEETLARLEARASTGSGAAR